MNGQQTQPSNLGSSGSNKTTNYFNNYYTPKIEISENINDAILSFFEQQTGNKESAKLLVQAVVDTAQAQREDPMVVLTTFQKMPPGELNAFLVLYLNLSRVNTSYLGVRNQGTSNPYVTRLIVS
jgi:hypothetical protein